MTLPSADEFLTGVSKHAHGSVDGNDYLMKIKPDDP